MSSFDWYKLSLLDTSQTTAQKFFQIISHSSISKSIQNVPTSYRKHLLICFQQVSTKMKMQIGMNRRDQERMDNIKDRICGKLEDMEIQVGNSRNQILRTKALLAQKKKIAKKLRQKIDTINKNKTKPSYFCPFCSLNTFTSQQQFSSHMFSLHPPLVNPLSQSSQSQSLQSNELKQFIISLKDKQMQMMKMILEQKNNLKTQQLQNNYERDLNFYTQKNQSMPTYLARVDQMEQRDDKELKGDSQFLFYQKSEQYRKQIQKTENQYSIRKAIQQQRKTTQNHPYYEVFKDLQENKSQNVEEHIRFENQARYQRTKQKPSNQQKTPNSYRIIQHSSQTPQSNPTSLLNQQINPLKMTQTNLQYQQFNPSITDRLKQNKKSSIYSSNQNYYQQEFIFQGKPLIDNKGLMVEKKFEQDVEDEEIKYPTSHYQNNHYSYQSKSFVTDRQQISQLLSPYKDQSHIAQRSTTKQHKQNHRYQPHYQNQKSSLIQLSDDSFSRRDLQVSKDDQTINLSDLKLSKLERKRDQQKQKNQQQKHPVTIVYSPKSINNEDKNTIFKKKHMEYVLVEQQVTKNEQKISLLNEFQVKVNSINIKPLLPNSYNSQRQQNYQLSEFYKKSPPNYQQRQSKLNLVQQNFEEKTHARSPQQFFSQDMIKQTNNHYKQEKISSELTQVHYQRRSYRKKIQVHQELLDGHNEILTEFIRKQYTSNMPIKNDKSERYSSKKQQAYTGELQFNPLYQFIK